MHLGKLLLDVNGINEDRDSPEDWRRPTRLLVRKTKSRSDFISKFFTVTAIAFMIFLFKINRKDSPNCYFGKKIPESSIHVFVMM